MSISLHSSRGSTAFGRLAIATDGHPARIPGRWAKEKLEAVGRDLQTVTTAMKNSKWKQGCCFLDRFAGGGRCILKGDGDEFDGSPIVALKCAPGCSYVVLVEQDPRLVHGLRARTAAYSAPAPTISAGNCDEISVITAIRAAVPRDALTIAFIDNLGWDVSLSTTSRTAADRRMDLIVTFQISALTHDVQQVLEDRGETFSLRTSGPAPAAEGRHLAQRASGVRPLSAQKRRGAWRFAAV